LGSKSVVGLWSVTLMSGQTLVDWGYSEWHADGTEIMNSGGHSPASGNFCLGVWRQSGPQTYHLKHYPLAYDPATGKLAVKLLLVEDVTVDQDGDKFTGTFALGPLAADGGFAATPQTGKITGKRIEPN
jgi:hypothetical protein